MKFFLLFVLLNVCHSNLFSQPKAGNVLINHFIHNRNYGPLEKMRIHNLDDLKDFNFELNAIAGNKQFVTFETADVVDSVIVKKADSSKEQSTYTINSNGNMTSYLIESWNGTDWVNDSQYTYTYDSNGNKTSSLWEYWGGILEAVSIQETYFYDAEGILISYYYDYWRDNQRSYYVRSTYAYDSNGNNTSILSEGWFISEGIWTNSLSSTFTYDLNGNMTSELRERWSWDGTSWILNDYDGFLNLRDDDGYLNIGTYHFFGVQINIYYTAITDVSNKELEIKDYTLLQNYPNPFNPSTVISYSLPQSDFVQLKVYDMLGREVAVLVNKEQKNGTYEVQFNASNIYSGVYFYRLQSGGFEETKKLVLLR